MVAISALAIAATIATATTVSIAITIAVTVAIIVSTAIAIPALVIVTVRLPRGFVRRGFRRLGGLDGGGSGWGRVAAEGTGVPVPAVGALRRREGIRWLVRSTAALVGVPRPVEGAVSVSGWAGGFAWSSAGKTAVLGGPPKPKLSATFSTSTRKTHLNCPLPQSLPEARTRGTAKTKRAMRAMSDISRDR